MVDFIIRVRAWREPVLEHDAVVAFATPVAQFSSSMRTDLADIGGPDGAWGNCGIGQDAGPPKLAKRARARAPGRASSRFGLVYAEARSVSIRRAFRRWFGRQKDAVDGGAQIAQSG